MTRKESQLLAAELTTDQVAILLREHTRLRDELCAYHLAARSDQHENWIDISIARAAYLNGCRHCMEQLLSITADAASAANERARLCRCTFCNGTGKTSKPVKPCPICRGSGRVPF